MVLRQHARLGGGRYVVQVGQYSLNQRRILTLENCRSSFEKQTRELESWIKEYIKGAVLQPETAASAAARGGAATLIWKTIFMSITVKCQKKPDILPGPGQALRLIAFIQPLTLLPLLAQISSFTRLDFLKICP